MSIVDKFKQKLSFPIMSAGLPNPSGTHVAINQTKANWRDNKYESNILIHKIGSDGIFQLTRSGSISSVDWIDDNSIVVVSNDDKDKGQVWFYSNLIGEPIQLTSEENGVSKVKAFANGIIYLSPDLKKFKDKQRKDHFGSYTHVEEEKPAAKLVYLSIEETLSYLDNLKQVTEDEAKKEIRPELNLIDQIDHPFKIYNFDAVGNRIIISGTEKPDLIFADQRINYILELDPDKELKDYVEEKKQEKDQESSDKKDQTPRKIGKLQRINLPLGASIIHLSPDASSLLISYQSRDQKYYTQGDLWTISVDVASTQDEITIKQMNCITVEIDHSIMGSIWTNIGIIISYFDHTRGVIGVINPDNNDFSEIELINDYHGAFFDANINGDCVLQVSHSQKMNELVFIPRQGHPTLITNQNSLIDEIIPVETIEWESTDGTIIEGVIRKPKNFDPKKKYPLVLIVHGGPSWLSYEQAESIVDWKYYPSPQFAFEDIITVYPNYRGSIGRGQSFLELNVNNLGIGDLWDIESCVDYLVNEGFVDETKVACMGWSQGGYISAMATTHSDKFVATSVGAGISDWYSYWTTTDIRRFTVDYLSASPIEDREIYHRTAPMSAIDKANTPTLIQIGENDQRVPLVNATELFRALQEKNVDTHLFVFSGMPHGINKPRENLAVVTQNYQWFTHYLLEKPLQLNLVELDSDT